MKRWKRLVKDGMHEAVSGVRDTAIDFCWTVVFPAAAGFLVGWLAIGLAVGVVGCLLVGAIAIVIWALRHGVVLWDP